MAYKDENGKITIDDVAAGEDIRKIERAQSILQNALQSLRAARQKGQIQKVRQPRLFMINPRN